MIAQLNFGFWEKLHIAFPDLPNCVTYNVTVWSPPSDASVDGLIMSTIISGHLEALSGILALVEGLIPVPAQTNKV
jgi:hypothetical protein